MSTKTILMVEDDPHIMNINRISLKKRGYNLLEAETLAKARTHLEENTPDLILLDVLLPDGTGIDFLREIKNIPVLILTALGESDDIVTGLEQGADDYLAKPYDPKELLARIEAILRRAKKIETITRGELTLNIARHEAFVCGEDVGLTRMQFLLLYYFMNNEGKIMQAEHLYKEVWGQTYNEKDNSLKMAVSRLREKIEPAGFLIEPVRGQGYRFKEDDFILSRNTVY